MVRFSDCLFFCLFPDHTRKKVVFCLSKVTSVLIGGELKVQCAVVLQHVSCVATDETLLQGLFFVGPSFDQRQTLELNDLRSHDTDKVK